MDYFQRPEINISTLAHMEKCPKKCYYSMYGPRVEKSYFTVGTLGHAIVCELHRMPEFAKVPAGIKRTYDPKDKTKPTGQFKELCEQHPEVKNWMLEDEYDTAYDCATALKENDVLQRILASNPAFEEEVYGLVYPSSDIENHAGVHAKCKSDIAAHSYDIPLITDLKLVVDASDHGFERAVVDHLYFPRAAWYLDLNPWAQHYLFVVVEKSPPYPTNVFTIARDSEYHQLGTKVYRHWLRQFLECKASGNWPDYGYKRVLKELTPPHWLSSKYDIVAA